MTATELNETLKKHGLRLRGRNRWWIVLGGEVPIIGTKLEEVAGLVEILYGS